MDDEIYASFRKEFPDLNVVTITDDILKSPEAKAKWAPFMMAFKDNLDMYNFLTMLRLDCRYDYTETNTTVGKSVTIKLKLTQDSPSCSILLHRACQIKRRTQQKHQNRIVK